MSAPVGQYDSSKLVNIGTNRWSIKPDIGISKAFGPLTLELSAGVTFFTKNDDYFGGKTLEQDPVYSTQTHVTYDFGRGVWGALDGTYYYGGRTTVNGVRGDDVQKNSRVGATLALPVNRNNSIKLFASTGVSTRTGSDYNLAGSPGNTAGAVGCNLPPHKPLQRHKGFPSYMWSELSCGLIS